MSYHLLKEIFLFPDSPCARDRVQLTYEERRTSLEEDLELVRCDGVRCSQLDSYD